MDWTHINEGLPEVPGGISDTHNIRILAIIKEEIIPDHIDQPNWRYDIKVVKYNRKYGFSEDVVYWTYISNVPALGTLPIKPKTIKLKNIRSKEDLLIKIEIDNSGSEMIFKMLDKYDRNWADEPWEVTFNHIFGTKLDYHETHHEILIPFSEFLKKCPYSERTILNYDIIFKDRNPSVGTLVID